MTILAAGTVRFEEKIVQTDLIRGGRISLNPITAAMRSLQLLAFVLYLFGVHGEDFVSVTLTTSIAVRDIVTVLPGCEVAPTDGSPPFCVISFQPTTVASTVASTTTPAPSCSMQNQDPDSGITSAYCVCNGSKTLPLLSAPSTAVATQSCAYSTIPDSQITPTISLGPVVTDISSCQICTPVENNADSCTTIPGCYPESATATVQVGSSPVHVGTLTGTALYTSISSALNRLCPSVTQTTSFTACSTDSVIIKDIDYIDDEALAKGELIVRVEASQYNATSLRDAMITSAALTANTSATGNNCYNATYYVEELRKRDDIWTPRGIRDWFSSPSVDDDVALSKRDHSHRVEEQINVCNAAQFAGVQYFGQYWRTAPLPGATAYIDANWEFTTGPGGDFICEFLQDLTDALIAIEPEFALGEVELGEELYAVCEAAITHL
ncbi:hypothetical protein CJF31_00002231 [Rutstroemia sp. NJR-2017a BVV2]|nr:hypothetical protein CJF31_00010170 [Rutstroemia sp. NJR-2017a BVV2]PQE24032.1 hypothetical protein CJF31_00002231 [Rutstroemia sp. NJR-2017a BVV2]